MVQKTMLEILDETVAYYSEDLSRRGINSEGLCVYEAEGRYCAVGRCLIDPKKFQEAIKNAGSATAIIYLKEKNLFNDSMFKEEYRGHPIKFWRNLQTLHDTKEFWVKGGLSDNNQILSGLKHYNMIVHKILSNEYILLDRDTEF